MEKEALEWGRGGAPLGTSEVLGPGWWQKERPVQNRAAGQQSGARGRVHVQQEWICGPGPPDFSNVSSTCLARPADPLGKAAHPPIYTKVLGTSRATSSRVICI